LQTVEAREDYHNRTLGAMKSGAQFIQTSFVNSTGLPKYAFSLGHAKTTLFPTNYTVGNALWHILLPKGLRCRVFASAISGLAVLLSK
jgi:hypothetical protein